MTPLTPEQSALAEANRGIAWMVARRFHRRPKDEDALNELVGIALLALCDAARQYDPARGLTFSTYASRACRHAIVNERCEGGLITTPRYLTRQFHKDHRYRAQRDRVRHLSFSPLVPERQEPVDPGADPVHQAELRELRARIRGLPAVEAHVVERHLEGWSISEIARQLGYSSTGVDKIFARATARLSSRMGR